MYADGLAGAQAERVKCTRWLYLPLAGVHAVARNKQDVLYWLHMPAKRAQGYTGIGLNF